jgi:hypothetical protein
MTGQILTDAQKSALKWLINRSGDGVFGRDQVLVAGGCRAPIMRSTWNRLAQAGAVEFYMKRRRLRVTDAGRAVDLANVRESYDPDEEWA